MILAITISVSGSTGEPLGCSLCDLSIDIAATMIDSASDCPEALQQDYESYIVSYDIQTLDDGTANWFFHDSGNQFATGTHTIQNSTSPTSSVNGTEPVQIFVRGT